MKKFLVFDTETDGLPKNQGAPFSDVNNWPRIIQLGFILIQEDGEILYKYSQLIKPDGWVIPKEKFWIDNGFSTEINEKHGIPISEALRELQDNLKQCDYKVAHNLRFDNNIVLAEMLRVGMTHQLMQFKKGICTMTRTTKLVQVKSHAGGTKWPKLIELHQHLFDCEFDGAHDALADVEATARCLVELLKRKHIVV